MTIIEIDTSEYANLIGVKKDILRKKIDALRYGLPPRYQITQRRKALEDLSYLIGIYDGLEKAGFVLDDLRLKFEEQK